MCLAVRKSRSRRQCWHYYCFRRLLISLTRFLWSLTSQRRPDCQVSSPPIVLLPAYPNHMHFPIVCAVRNTVTASNIQLSSGSLSSTIAMIYRDVPGEPTTPRYAHARWSAANGVLAANLFSCELSLSRERRKWTSCWRLSHAGLASQTAYTLSRSTTTRTNTSPSPIHRSAGCEPAGSWTWPR